MLRKSHFVFATAAAAVVSALALQPSKLTPISQSQAVTTQAPSAQPVVGRQLPDFSTLVEQAGPAVVNISVVRNARTAEATPGMDDSDPMFEFFRRFQIPAPQPVPQQGVGSGFIIAADGHILTNAHVVADASEVTVKLTDKREFKAKVLGVDRRTDVALIKIDGKNMPTVKIGDSSQVKVGAWVGRGDRHQLADLQPHRRIHGRVICDPN